MYRRGIALGLPSVDIGGSSFAVSEFERKSTMHSAHTLSRWTVAVALFTAVSLGSGVAQAAGQQYPPAQYPQQSAPPPYPSQGQQYPPSQSQYPPPNYPQGSQYPQSGQYPAGGQYPPGYPPPASLSPQQLDQLTGPIALYPDGLLAQVLTASTYSNQIPDAAGWANAHQYLRGRCASASHARR